MKIFFDSLSTNVVLIAVTIITYCIWEYESKEHRLDKFKKLNVKNKWTFAYINDWSDWSEAEIYNTQQHKCMSMQHEINKFAIINKQYWRFCYVVLSNRLIMMISRWLLTLKLYSIYTSIILIIFHYMS